MASGSRSPVSGSVRTNFFDDVPLCDWRTSVFSLDSGQKHTLQGWKHCIELPRLPRTVVEQYKYIIDQLTTVLMISCLTPSA